MAEPALTGRGEETRAQLLDAGLKLFSERGFDGVTTRQIARRADVNVAAIAYHFGGKRELYRGVLAQIVTDTDSLFVPANAAIAQDIATANGDRRVFSRLAAMLVANIIRRFIEDDAMRPCAAMVLREYALPSEDFDILFKGRIEPMHRAVTELAAAALGLSPDDPKSAMRAHSVMGQILVFGLAREVLMRRLGWKALTPERLALLIATATDSVLASLDLPPLAKDDRP